MNYRNWLKDWQPEGDSPVEQSDGLFLSLELPFPCLPVGSCVFMWPLMNPALFVFVAVIIGTGSAWHFDWLHCFPTESRSQSSHFLPLHSAKSFSMCHSPLKPAAWSDLRSDRWCSGVSSSDHRLNTSSPAGGLTVVCRGGISREPHVYMLCCICCICAGLQLRIF